MPPESLERPLNGRDWRDDALCRGMGSHFFFKGAEVRDIYAFNARATDICFECKVTEPCLAEGVAVYIQTGFSYGVWGGFTPRQVKRIADEQKGTK